jgi:FxsC-like protein
VSSDISNRQHELDQARENLRLIQERESEYVSPTDIPLQFVKEKRSLQNKIAELEKELERPLPKSEGAGRIKIVYIVAKEHELTSERQNRDCYKLYYTANGTPAAWQPYWPPRDEMIGIVCQRAVTSQAMHYESSYQDADSSRIFADWIRDAQKSSAIFICIVDPWCLYIDSYKTLLDKYDRKNLLNSGVLIPWNDLDSDYERYSSELRERMRETFKKTVTRAQAWVLDTEQLQTELIALIYTIRKAMIRANQFAKSEKTPMPSHDGPVEEIQK